MKYIHFIVNPISGKGNHNLSTVYINSFFPASEYNIKIEYTQHKKHAIELASKAVAASADCIIACGGDGTINEVASSLVGTEIKLGIVPVGSGNGLAANLGISGDIETALETIKAGIHTAIDVGSVNGHHFFSNAGTGIDAMIIKKYERLQGRTLINYIRATISSSLSYNPWKTELTFNGSKTVLNPLMVFVSNSNQMGYNMSLTPKASLTDGWLDLIIIPQLGFFEKLLFGYYVLRNQTGKFRKVNHVLVDKLTIEMPDRIFTDIQLDGEHCNLKTNKMQVSLIKSGLIVLVGKKV